MKYYVIQDFDSEDSTAVSTRRQKKIDKGNASFSILWPALTKFDNCSTVECAALHMSFGGHENHHGTSDLFGNW